MPSTAPGLRPVALLLPFSARSVGLARRQLAAAMRERRLPREFVDDAVLVLSELVSNALRHARPLRPGARHEPKDAILVAWLIGDDDVRLEVTDGGAGTLPRAGTPTRSATGGRGLHIVRDLAVDWGIVEETGAQALDRIERSGDPRDPGDPGDPGGPSPTPAEPGDELGGGPRTMTVWATLRQR